MRKLVLGLSILAAAAFFTHPASSAVRILGEPPLWPDTYGDVVVAPGCLYWNWQERSWYDACWWSRHPLAWTPARHRARVIVRTKY